MRRSCPEGMPLAKTVELKGSGEHDLIMFHVYVLRSEKVKMHYYGHSKDLDNRIKKHNLGRVRSTKSGKPWKLLYSERFDSKSEAYRREMFFKSIEGYRYLKDKGII